MVSWVAMRRALGGALVLAAILVAGPAAAQSANDKAAAETLFEQGRALLQKGKYAEACPKLAESLRLDTGIGTMLYLAECYERSGKTASAWAQFREAQETARQAGDSREKVARDRADKLEPKLSRLAIVVPKEVSGLVVTRDGREVGKPVWGTPTPIDAGKHVIRASAAGYEPFETTVDVGADRASAKVEIPALVAKPPDQPAPAPVVVAAPAPVPEEGHGGGQRTIAIGVGILGLVGVGVGSVFGLEAISTLSDADQHCSGNACDQQGLDLRSDSRSQATISTIGFVVGGVALAGAAVLWFTAPKSRAAVGIAPATNAGVPGLSALGRF
jgi:hypothetical protein